MTSEEGAQSNIMKAAGYCEFLAQIRNGLSSKQASEMLPDIFDSQTTSRPTSPPTHSNALNVIVNILLLNHYENIIYTMANKT